MNLQNLTYTISNLSSRQKMAALAGIVGASAVISTIALSQRQPSSTTVNRSIPNTSIPPTTTTLPSTLGNLDTTQAPGIATSPDTNTSRFNIGTEYSPENNLKPGNSSVAPDTNLSLGMGREGNNNLNLANPNPVNPTISNLSPITPGRVFVPNTPSQSMTSISPIPGANSPIQNFSPREAPTAISPTISQDSLVPTTPAISPTISQDSLVPTTPSVNPAISQDSLVPITPADSPLPSSTESTPTFDSRTGTYTTTPRATSNSSGSVNSPGSSFANPSGSTSNGRNGSDFYSNPNFSRSNGGSSNANPSNPIYGSSNGTSNSNPIYSSPNGSTNSNSIYGSPNGGSTSNTVPN